MLFSHPSKRQGLVLLRMSGPLVTAGQVFVGGMNGCLSLSMKDHVGHKNVRVTFQVCGACAEHDSERATRGDAHLVHRSLERLCAKPQCVQR